MNRDREWGSPVLWCKAAGERARLEDPIRRPSQDDGSAHSIISHFRIEVRTVCRASGGLYMTATHFTGKRSHPRVEKHGWWYPEQANEPASPALEQVSRLHP